MGRRSSVSDVESLVIRPTPQHFAPPPPKPWFPCIVLTIFLINIALFCCTMYVNNCPMNTGADLCLLYRYLGRFSFQPIRQNLLLGPSTAALEYMGGLDRRYVVQLGQTWRLLSSMWLHAGVIHLVVNMTSLLFIGVPLEQEFGFLRISILYIASGFGGSLASILRAEPSQAPVISVGASGALFGMLGSMLSEFLINWTIYTNKCQSLSSMLSVIALNIAVGIIPGVDMAAHLGGLYTGFFLGFVVLMRPQFGYVNSKYIPPAYDIKHKKPKYRMYQYVLFSVGLMGLIAGYAAAYSKLFSDQEHLSSRISSATRSLTS